MVEKAVGIVGLCVFILLTGFITTKIGEVALWIVSLLVSAMVAYDFYRDDIFKTPNGSGTGSSSRIQTVQVIPLRPPVAAPQPAC